MKTNFQTTISVTETIQNLIFIMIICLLGIVVYSNTLNSPFVFDDVSNIELNEFIRIDSVDYQNLYGAGRKSINSRRPVANISFALNYYAGRYNVLGYHIVNITIHLINGIIVYFLSITLFKQTCGLQNQKKLKFIRGLIPLMSLFTSLLFISHPIQTQSVTYIVQRMNSLAAMFYLLALLLYIKGRLISIRRKQWLLFIGVFLSWLLAIGSKEIAATLPLTILVYEWYFFQDLRLAWVTRNLKFIIGALVIFGLVAFIYLGDNPLRELMAPYSYRNFTMAERVLTQFRVVLFYISLLLWPLPSRLNLLHHFTTSTSLIAPPTTLLSLLIIVALIGLAVFLAKRQRLLSFCIICFFINLVIESSVIGLEMIFEHRLYLPMFSFCLIVSYVLFNFLSNRRLWAIVIPATIILSLSTAAHIRNNVWKDNVTLWKDCVEKSPQLARPHCNLGIALAKKGQTDDAIEHYLEALRIEPYLEEAHNSLGLALAKKGQTDDAIKHYLEALRIKPDYEKAHNNLGIALYRKGDIAMAVKHFRKAVQLKPNALTRGNLKKALNLQNNDERK